MGLGFVKATHVQCGDGIGWAMGPVRKKMCLSGEEMVGIRMRLGRGDRDEVKEPGVKTPSGCGMEGEVGAECGLQTPTWAGGPVWRCAQHKAHGGW